MASNGIGVRRVTIDSQQLQREVVGSKCKQASALHAQNASQTTR